MGHRRTGWVAALLAALALGAAACGGGDQGVAGAEQDLCGSLADLATAITVLADLGTDSTKEEMQTAADGIRDATEQVKSDAADVAEADTTALANAQESLQSAVNDLPDNTTYRKAFQELRPELNEVRDTYQEIHDGLNCQ